MDLLIFSLCVCVIHLFLSGDLWMIELQQRSHTWQSAILKPLSQVSADHHIVHLQLTAVAGMIEIIMLITMAFRKLIEVNAKLAKRT